MIYDILKNAGNYTGLHPNLDLALQYIASHDLNKLPTGRTEVKGSDVFINVMETQAGDANQKTYEFHKNYMDIQIDLKGTELIRTGSLAGMTESSYDAGNDFGIADCAEASSCIMGPGRFIICMAGEPHMPGIRADENTHLLKCVFKVHIADFNSN